MGEFKKNLQGLNVDSFNVSSSGNEDNRQIGNCFNSQSCFNLGGGTGSVGNCFNSQNCFNLGGGTGSVGNCFNSQNCFNLGGGTGSVGNCFNSQNCFRGSKKE